MSKKEKNLTSLENISYENGVGLSEHIAKLIAPPVSAKAKGKDSKPNNDICSFCREGGVLMCCDKCPAAFHFQCCEPPLDTNNLPEDDWICSSCEPPKPDPDTGNKYVSNVVYDIPQHPAPFTLPEELLPTTYLPGTTHLPETEHQSRKRRNLNPVSYDQNKRKFNPAFPYDLQNFTPTPVCYKCDKSDRSERQLGLIFCCYCPMAFHLDCIYPPLTYRPAGMWMCPLHPQYSMPKFHSLRLSARIQAHETALEPVNEHAVRTKFLKKAKKCQNSIESVQRITTIPEAVVQYYKIGLAFCRSNIALKTPKSLKELSAAKVSENMVAAEKDSTATLSSVCLINGCKHAARQCKHYRQSAASVPANYNSNSESRSKDKRPTNLDLSQHSTKIKQVAVKKDNGLLTQDIGKLLQSYSESTIRHLAVQFLEQQHGLSNGEVKVLPSPPPLSAAQFTVPKPLTPHKVSENCMPLSHVVAHSFLIQGDTKYPIKKNSFVIGIGHRADLKLDEGVCEAVSLRHCCILFDKVTGIHELLNYSEYGTVVNSLFYGCSATPHCVSRCVCSPTVPIHGWEGPCQLPDGAHIKVGCHSFSFRTNPEFTWTPELVIPSDRVLHDDTLEFLS